MRKRGILNAEGEMEWFDEKGNPCEPPSSKPIEDGVAWVSTGKGWPVLSDSMGCHPDQVQQFREDSVQKGVPTDFTKDGRAILNDASHHKKYRKAYGYVDRSGYD